VRLGHRLATAVRGRGTVYRMGGDEFCALLDVGVEPASHAAASLARTLNESGESFVIDAAYGVAVLPEDAVEIEEALRVADQRMYQQKHDARPTAIEQTRGALLRALAARSPDLGAHLDGVADLAEAVAMDIGLAGHELETVRVAAQLHDVGKMAVPDSILSKPGPLDDTEWRFIRGHTLVGERILEAAPALRPVARAVRSAHENFGGGGYPDGLRGDKIPLVSRVVFVCDAYDAMIAGRPYRPPLAEHEALAELERCAGTQFDPDVVEALARVVATRRSGAAAA